MTQINMLNQATEEEISIQDIVKFCRDSYRLILAIGIISLCIAVLFSFFAGRYSGETILANNDSLNIISWKTFQKSLPMLANEISSKDPSFSSQKGYLASNSWWEKNVIANQSLTKKDTKELISQNKELDQEATRINNFLIKAEGPTVIKTQERIRDSIDFMVNGISYLSYKNLINQYLANISNNELSSAKKLIDSEIELNFSNKRLKNLNDLKAQFPNQNQSISQVVDPKDSGAKYLPISTQIIATNTDINQLRETITRLRDEQQKIQVFKKFTEDIKELFNTSYDSKFIHNELIQKTANLKNHFDGNNLNYQQAIKSIENDLMAIQIRQNYGLDQVTSPMIKAPPHLKHGLIGGLLGLILGLMIAMVRKMKDKFSDTP